MEAATTKQVFEVPDDVVMAICKLYVALAVAVAALGHLALATAALRPP